eukprot:5982285-Amphidinium_carterae.2
MQKLGMLLLLSMMVGAGPAGQRWHYLENQAVQRKSWVAKYCKFSDCDTNVTPSAHCLSLLIVPTSFLRTGGCGLRPARE